ncbi:MAG TPA: histone deacetylase family protein [Beijerinckiaceae bacterium]|nr:histone deacetylase family protein [Beijerinckiaceae bacterium]
MSTLYLTHPSGIGHDMGYGHPEQPKRLVAIEEALSAEKFQSLIREAAPRGTSADILRVHPEAYLRAIDEAAPTDGLVQLDGDTAMSPGTWEACMHAVGAASQAVDEVMAGKIANAFVAMRPPGHHAETATPMGFCFFNNVAIAARRSRAVHGAERVAIMDFDVHHGNGTQEIFWNDPSVLYTSTHQMPLYPGTGAKSETGAHDTIVNAPLRAGDDGERFREAMTDVVLKRIDAFSPDLVIISAGFDAHRKDPLAQLGLIEEDFAWATRQLLDIAERRCKGRLVSVLEGGYNLDALGKSVAAHVSALMERV